MIDLDQLDEDQRVAATAPRGPVCILAGAGTGKTRTITYRIAHLIDQGFVVPQKVLAVTFTSRAAGEMRDRLRTMGIGGVQARTFHAAALRQLRYFWPQVAGDLPWTLIDNKFPLVARATRTVGLEPDKELVRDLLGEIEWAKASLITPEGYAGAIENSHREPPAAAEKVAAVYKRYEEAKTSPEGMALDFDDLLLHVAGALENAPAVAEEFRNQYQTFVVDEYQDVTPLQQRVLEGWLGQRDDLTVVGDANQTIYSFTGATPDYLLNFSRTYPHGTVVKLQRDYRSTPEVTDLANTVISKATGREAGTRLELQGMRDPGPEPTFASYPDEPSEARDVAAQIKKLIAAGTPAREIAVLYRINAQSAVFEQALSDAGVVYQVRGGEGFFTRPEIREAINVLVSATRRNDLPDDPVAVAKAAFAPLGLSATEPEGARQRERWQTLNALVELIADIVRTGEATDLPGVLGSLRQRAEAKQPPAVDGVTLASLHAAKGLEWDAVFLAGLVEKTLPISHAIKAGDDQIEEERRLFYVGITRAREHLHLSWSLARQEGGRASRERSRFLDGIAPQLDVEAAPERLKRSKRCRVCGNQLATPAEKSLGRHEDCEPTYNEAAFLALKQWRLEVAREAQHPPYMVFTDATLLSVVEAMPASEGELLDISGIGPAKLEQYGEDLLAVLEDYR
ncbi:MULTISPECIES: ATP-dependent DNA helicase UvrD2 [unclassified Corynebacterium]|uniref:ATP-dependent DNA helicase UvrD2 n=1 Tax=unclassified Corynebacterium TaxID=2624378 RepID=UPI0021A9D43A|nr:MULTISPECIES: ATP-dependent DNA helicase UvrD2 [unclassified Corynebacterium]MCT1451871.1 ATP-dependent DNA helicase UvrD2 [Corynebacterium sp. p3-SID1145]MCT1461154.1 ATP-dependent DNA helicase UvrD2 [Corynebacterium sp. p3-SID1140]MDN8595158.1 ATP-dependent DNA helicase UvrD2 [Corynebacterium sp. P4_F2]WKK56609.1 ATP-dependent DNA helicase UvrD2 [Corynebacterium sp. P4-C1]WKK64046.1 ATP-dependent DNA helicase UvrD2 [Corynebacterium sp. P8-C1]